MSDSLDYQYTAEIFPKGGFHYFPPEGFTGEASRIVVKGRIKRGMTSVDFMSGTSSLTEQKSVDLRKKEMSRKSAELKEKEVKKPGRVGPWWVILLFAGVGLVGGGGRDGQDSTGCTLCSFLYI